MSNINAEEAKKLRTSSKRIFTRRMNTCKQAIDDGLREDIVLNRMQDLKDAWMRTQLAHEDYIQAIESPEGKEDDWLNEVDINYNETEKSCLVHIEKVRQTLLHEAEKSRMKSCETDIKKARVDRTVLYSLFANQLDFLDNTMKTKVDKNHPIEISANAHTSLLSAFEKVKESHIALLELLENINDKIDWLIKPQNLLNEATSRYLAYKSQNDTTIEERPHSHNLNPALF